MDMESVMKEDAIHFWADPYPANLIHSDDMCDQVEALFAAAFGLEERDLAAQFQRYRKRFGLGE